MKKLIILAALAQLAACTQNVYPAALAEAQTMCDGNGGLKFANLAGLTSSTIIVAVCKNGTEVTKRVSDKEKP